MAEQELISSKDDQDELSTNPNLLDDGLAGRTFIQRARRWRNKNRFTIYTTLLLTMLVVSVLAPRIFIMVPSGSHAVMYRMFFGGTVTDRVWGEGMNIIPPWDTLTTYETRMQQQTLKFKILSEEGLDIGVEVSIRFRAIRESLGYLHRDIGTDYFQRLVRPEVESHIRRTMGTRPVYETYATTHGVLQEISNVTPLARLDGNGVKPYVQIFEVKLVDIDLPEIIESAIAEKYRQEQMMLEYKYKLEREAREAKRKRTEAAGIRDYNIIAEKVSPQLLKWRGIEASLELAKASLELAKSPNAKVVVLGAGPGTQMLLNVDAMANTAEGAPAQGTPAKSQTAGNPAQSPAGAAASALPPPTPPEDVAPAPDP
jgi:regulator of protease activity HflC (stomatin/prohibitin superfamily)